METPLAELAHERCPVDGTVARGEVLIVIAVVVIDVEHAEVAGEFVNDGAEVAGASPFAPGAGVEVGWFRGLMSSGVALLYRMALRDRAGDLTAHTCAFRAYRREVLDELVESYLLEAAAYSQGLNADSSRVAAAAKAFETQASLRPGWEEVRAEWLVRIEGLARRESLKGLLQQQIESGVLPTARPCAACEVTRSKSPASPRTLRIRTCSPRPAPTRPSGCGT